RLGVSVAGAAAGGVDHLAQAVADAGLDEVDAAHDVDGGVKPGLPHPTLDVHLRRMVVDHLGLLTGENLLQRFGIGDIDLVERGVGVEVRGGAGGEIVHNGDLVTEGQVAVHDIGADEPGPARDKYFH